eukprot:TRINITY_DN43829_c0_g1_i1.p1 TRINITY_DN43829_c0_g1~~TRINITY_DN43829_c0_g1_i1.p1  ORF type:complete len:110 (-),score=4.21 TRINITY_DN43829_c0_g1_i1:572-901(-)
MSYMPTRKSVVDIRQWKGKGLTSRLVRQLSSIPVQHGSVYVEAWFNGLQFHSLQPMLTTFPDLHSKTQITIIIRKYKMNKLKRNGDNIKINTIQIGSLIGWEFRQIHPK